MPEGLQSSYRGMCSEDAIDNMEEASEKLDEVIELLGDIAQRRLIFKVGRNKEIVPQIKRKRYQQCDSGVWIFS